MVGALWCHVGAPIKGKLWMKYVHTGLYSASSWPCTATADSLPLPQVLPVGYGHGEHLTSLSKSCQGAGTFSRHGTTAMTPKETMWMVVGVRHCLDSVSSHYSLPWTVWHLTVLGTSTQCSLCSGVKTLSSMKPKYSLYRLHMNDNT